MQRNSISIEMSQDKLKDMSDDPIPEWANQWLQDLDAEHDSINLRRAYIDVCDGDHVAAIIFAQIMYWYLPDKKSGKTRLRVKKNGCLWLAKQHDRWWKECRVKKGTAKTKIAKLEELGLIYVTHRMFGARRTTHIRINFAGLRARLKLDDLPLTVNPVAVSIPYR